MKIRGQQRIKQISSGCRGTLRTVSSFPYRCSPFLPPVIPIWSVLIQGCFVPCLTQGLRHWPLDVSILDNNPLKLWQAKQRIQPPAAHMLLNNTFSLHPWANPQTLISCILTVHTPENTHAVPLIKIFKMLMICP